MPTYYAVSVGKKPGIYSNWKDCEENIKGFSNARYKKFYSISEANEFIVNGASQPRTTARLTNFFQVKKTPPKNLDSEVTSDEHDPYIPDPTKESVNIYTDGSFFTKNGKKCAGYGIYIPSKDIKRAKPLNYTKRTNNRAELTAIIEAIKIFVPTKDVRLNIYTDSKYSILICTGTGARYAHNGFKRTNGGRGKGDEVPNKDLIIEMLELLKMYDLNFIHVYSHTSLTDEHSNGNRIVDQLAVKGALEDYTSQFSDKKNGLANYKLMHGKYKGEIINKVPVSYLQWIVNSEKFEGFCLEKDDYRLEKEIVQQYLRV
jgi:ribonuclease HI